MNDSTSFDFIKTALPQCFAYAVNAEQTIDTAPLIALDHLKQIGLLLVHHIVCHEDIKSDNTGSLFLIEALRKYEILPAHFIAALRQLEYLDSRESELFVDASDMKRLLLHIYDLCGWYYKTYIDDRFEPSPYILSQASIMNIASEAKNHLDIKKSYIRIDDKVLEAIWEEGITNEQTIELGNNESYRGQILNGMKHGSGVYRWPDGTKYTGQWSRDTEHGLGEICYSNGDKYRGEWQQGLFHGSGIYVWKDGTSYEGQWEDNLEHGFGIKTYKDGTIQKGFWTCGELVFTAEQLNEGQFSIAEE